MPDKNISELKEWAVSQLSMLTQASHIRQTSGQFPQSIELQLRNLSEAYHKIALECTDILTKQSSPVATLSSSDVTGTPLSESEQAILDKLNTSGD